MSDSLRAAIERIVEEEWPEYVDHLVVGTSPSLLLTYIKRDLVEALAASERPPVDPLREAARAHVEAVCLCQRASTHNEDCAVILTEEDLRAALASAAAPTTITTPLAALWPSPAVPRPEGLTAAIAAEVHVDEAHGFPPGFGPADLAAAILVRLSDTGDT